MLFRAMAAAAVILASGAPVYGDWDISHIPNEHGEEVKLAANASSDDGGGAHLSITCDEEKGFEIELRLDRGTRSPPQQVAYVLVDHGAPLSIEAGPVETGIPFPALVIHHAEPIERAISGAHRIGIRYDEGYGTVSTYYFDFTNLSAGRNLLMKACPA